jgi:hypothetical protein
MEFLMAGPIIVLVALAGGFMLWCRRCLFPGKCLPSTTEWISDLSLERYRPMLRLLDGEDFEFLRQQPGYTRQMGAKLRVQRCRIFRGYLRSLNQEFQRVSAAVTLYMVQSQQDRPDLAGTLLRQQFQFAACMLLIRGRLLLFRCGLGRVEAGGLLQLFDGVRLQLRTMVPAELM